MSIFKRITGGKGRSNKPNGMAQPCLRPSATLSPARHARIWAIGGGKGGTGKSFVASNFALVLARQSKKVLLIDADLGAANLHTFLGLKGSNLSLSSFLKAEVTNLDPLIKATGVAGLDIITGAMDSLDVADVSTHAIERLRDSLSRTDYDNIIIDIGPGTSSNMLGLLLIANNAVIVTTPEPTSVENTYRYLKSILLKRVREIIHSNNKTILCDILLKILKDGSNEQIKTVSDIMTLLKREERVYPGLIDSFMGKMSLSIVISQSRSEADRDVGRKMSRACHDFFALDIGYAGDIPYIERIRDRLFQKQAANPENLGYGESTAFQACVDQLLTHDKQYTSV